MKRVVIFSVVALLMAMLFSCGPKPAYQTREGKKKLKYYNDIQFGRNSNPKKKF